MKPLYSPASFLRYLFQFVSQKLQTCRLLRQRLGIFKSSAIQYWSSPTMQPSVQSSTLLHFPTTFPPFPCYCSVLYVTYNAFGLDFEVMFSCQHLSFLLGRAKVICFHMICAFLWTCAQRLWGTQTDPACWLNIRLDQKAKCILLLWYTNFRYNQCNKYNNVLNFNMWLNLTSVWLPINSLQLQFLRGKGMHDRLGLNQWNSIVHETFYCTK